jgi:hypothetical protein
LILGLKLDNRLRVFKEQSLKGSIGLELKTETPT